MFIGSVCEFKFVDHKSEGRLDHMYANLKDQKDQEPIIGWHADLTDCVWRLYMKELHPTLLMGVNLTRS